MGRNFIIPLLLALFLISSSWGKEKEVWTFLETQAPEVYAECLNLKNSDPKSYKSAFKDAKIAMTEFNKVMSYDSHAAQAYLEMYRVDFIAIGCSDEIALSKNPAKRAKLRKTLSQLIGQSYDHWVIYERARLKHLQSELNRLISEFEQNARSRESVIKRDVNLLIEESSQFWKKQQ